MAFGTDQLESIIGAATQSTLSLQTSSLVAPGGTLNCVYTPSLIQSTGNYHLKLEVTSPNGAKEEEQYQSFHYPQSSTLKLFRNRYQSLKKGGTFVYKGFQRGNDF